MILVKRKESVPRKVCTMCGKERRIDTEYWTRKDGSKMDICKKCAGTNVDIKKPETFLWILKEVDVPFIESLWVNVCHKQYNKDPNRFKPPSVLGVYLRVMRTETYKTYHYEDTLGLNKAHLDAKNRRRELEREGSDDNVSDTVEDLSDVQADKDKKPEPQITESLLEQAVKNALSKERPDKPIDAPPVERFTPIITIDEQSILDDMTENEKQTMALKWGESFAPSEWLKMEDMFSKYCGEYEMSVDREETLIAMCKTNINMQRCLDSGDAASASKFSSMFDQLRKSGAFTEAQKKEGKEKYLDSVGELVAAVEREGGIIPQFDYEFEVPQDKVDITLRDMKAYTYNLVKNEMGLGTLIETYIKKLEEDMEMSKNKTLNLEEGLVTSKYEEQELRNDKEANTYLDNLEDEIGNWADMVG